MKIYRDTIGAPLIQIHTYIYKIFYINVDILYRSRSNLNLIIYLIDRIDRIRSRSIINIYKIIIARSQL